MKKLVAWIVGIDLYDEPGWNIAGPCANALAVANWVRATFQERAEIHAFLSPKSAAEEAGIDELEKAASEDLKIGGARTTVTRDTRSDVLDTFWRTRLSQVMDADSRLFVFWSGHGYADKDGERILICNDYRNPNMSNRVFNWTNVARHVSMRGYHNFREQIWLADVCAKQADVKITADKSDPDVLDKPTPQVIFHATREGEYATGNGGRGAFTEESLKVLESLTQWPNLKVFEDRMNRAMEASSLPTFSVSSWSPLREYRDRPFGVSQRTQPIAGSLIELFRGPSVHEEVYRKHYTRTVDGLRNPALHRVEGMHGMVRELAGLSDGVIPYGLVEFLLRLKQEEALKDPIDDWIARHAAAEGHYLTMAQEKIDREQAVKVLLVKVLHDVTKGKISGWQLSVCTPDMKPLGGPSHPQETVSGWDDFCQKLTQAVDRLRAYYENNDFEIHFAVDAPLFDLPFHAIPMTDGTPLGATYLVLVRYVNRQQPAPTMADDCWKACAKALRTIRLTKARMRPVALGTDQEVSPEDPALFYATFSVELGTDGPAGMSPAKLTLLELLRRGAPCLYWLHSLPSEGWPALEEYIERWRKAAGSFPELPVALARHRTGGTRLARQATLLWDDPETHSISKNRGITRS